MSMNNYNNYKDKFVYYNRYNCYNYFDKLELPNLNEQFNSIMYFKKLYFQKI